MVRILAIDHRSTLLLGVLAGALVAACLVVLRPFFAPIVWAAVLAYVSWPPYRLLRALLRDHDSGAGFVMTMLVFGVIVIPILWLSMLAGREVGEALHSLAALLAQDPHRFADTLGKVPILGALVQDVLDLVSGNPAVLQREIAAALQRWSGNLLGALRGVGQGLGELLFCFLILFFLYRDGERLAGQASRLRTRYFHDRLDAAIGAVGAIVRAVVYGFVLTVVAQGLMAAIGYWLLGVQAPALLGALTALAAPIPLLGTSVVWGPVAASLILHGQVWQGVLLLVWGFLLVHPVDNMLRPLVISNMARLPFLAVMFGVFGGLAAFGVAGLVLGPVVLGVASLLWDRLVDARLTSDASGSPASDARPGPGSEVPPVKAHALL
jgi:predicted PurR-regulated permease PerM